MIDETENPAERPEKKEVLFHGIPASPGIAIGKILLVGGLSADAPAPESRQISDADVDREMQIFHSAVDKTREEIQELQKRLQNSLEEREASIFDAHLLIVDDRMLHKEVTEAIRKKHLPADMAFSQTIQRYIAAISSVSDQYLKDRADDVKDVAGRIMNNLNGLKRQSPDLLSGPTIIIARDLTPSDTAMLDRKNVLGFAIETGSRTSHTAILARSLRIPAVVGMQHFFERLQNGDLIIIDGFLGMVIIHPKQETLDLYEMKVARKEKLYLDLLKESRLRAETLDGYCVQLVANVEGVDGVAELQRNGAEGIGLFRTEFLYMNSTTLPSEEKQFEAYKQLAESMQDQPVIIRTLDVGGDKIDATLTTYHEPNPFLGMRAIRLCHDKPMILRTQMRAILRAGVFGNIKMLFPMVSAPEELDALLDMLQEEKRKLMSEQQSFAGNMDVGVMIEIPSAAIAAERLAEKVDFFSIGSNDLVQYTLAADRTNEKVAYLYKPSNPAVLELIRRTVDAARNHAIFVSVCGEIAGDPVFTPVLVGLGIQELSMSPSSLGMVRRIIRRMKMHDAEALAQKMLACPDAGSALELATEYVNRIAPDLTSM